MGISTIRLLMMLILIAIIFFSAFNHPPTPPPPPPGPGPGPGPNYPPPGKEMVYCEVPVKDEKPKCEKMHYNTCEQYNYKVYSTKENCETQTYDPGYYDKKNALDPYDDVYCLTQNLDCKKMDFETCREDHIQVYPSEKNCEEGKKGYGEISFCGDDDKCNEVKANDNCDVRYATYELCESGTGGDSDGYCYINNNSSMNCAYITKEEKNNGDCKNGSFYKTKEECEKNHPAEDEDEE
tara:strand:+ start:6002 stop:6715 length:714 start_codon:yes stop_codon:yes gene_type:complete